MKFLSCFVLHILLCYQSYGQEVKTVKKKVLEQYGKAIFYTLASNDTVKHGSYIMKAYTGTRLLYKGNYSYNKKVGLWKEQYYCKDYRGPKATGNYQNDQKIGEWTYFGKNGDTVQVYDWTKGKMIYQKLCGIDTLEYKIWENGQEKMAKLECPPTCVSGTEYLLYEMEKDLDATQFREISPRLYELKTTISVLINENNEIENITFSTIESENLKEIIENYLRTYRWIAGKKGEKIVKSVCQIHIHTSSQY